MTKHWLMFIVAPHAALDLLKRMGRGDAQFTAMRFPPDVRVVDTVYDTDRDVFVLVLESEFYDPVEVEYVDGQWRGSWNELHFEIGSEDDPSGEVWRHRSSPPPPDARWEAYFLPPRALMRLLDILATGQSYSVPPLPPDVCLVDAHYEAERDALVLFLESGMFEVAPCLPTPDGGMRITLPERWLTAETNQK